MLKIIFYNYTPIIIKDDIHFFRQVWRKVSKFTLRNILPNVTGNNTPTLRPAMKSKFL